MGLLKRKKQEVEKDKSVEKDKLVPYEKEASDRTFDDWLFNLAAKDAIIDTLGYNEDTTQVWKYVSSKTDVRYAYLFIGDSDIATINGTQIPTYVILDLDWRPGGLVSPSIVIGLEKEEVSVASLESQIATSIEENSVIEPSYGMDIDPSSTRDGVRLFTGADVQLNNVVKKLFSKYEQVQKDKGKVISVF